MRRLAFLGLLLGVAGGLRAEPAETPFLIFREADPPTQKEIRDLITEKQLGGRDLRWTARERLAWIGPWSVPFLAAALERESSARVRMNAVIALMHIRDPRALPALRAAATVGRDRWVRRAAILALGTFEHDADVTTLKGLLGDKEWATTAAPALARLRQPGAAAVLSAAELPRDEHAAAAILLAAAIATPDAPLIENLENEKLVQLAAAAGLAVRPASPRRAGEILAIFGRSKLTDAARVLAIRALGAIENRPPDVQAKLLDLACKDGPAEERIAALLELQGRADEHGPLSKALGRAGSLNDPVALALLLALARTREEKAIRQLKSIVLNETGSVRFYAAASLLFVYPALEPRLQEEIQGPLRDLKGNKEIEDFEETAKRVIGQTDKEKQIAVLREVFRDLADPRNLRLFMTREERNWREVNTLFATILQLDKVVDQFNAAGPGREQESPLGGGGGGGEEPKKASSGTLEEQDLFDILLPPKPPLTPADRDHYYGPKGAPDRPPYLGKGDLLGAG